MSKRVQIFGAGSIGNHLSHAARSLGWSVDLCDTDDQALKRTKLEIYPSRYRHWDEGIRLWHTPHDAPEGPFDLVVIGTPPESHIELATTALRGEPGAVLIEKPLCTPELTGTDELSELSRTLGIPVFTGYDHVVSQATRKVAELVGLADPGSILTIDVEFREHWGGIFAAHPWLDGPADSYLGYWDRGGGACGEHSHAANLWQYLARVAGAGRVVEVDASLDYVQEGAARYDRIALLNLRTETGLIGRVVQDVVSSPPRKWARLQGDVHIEWHCNRQPGYDVVVDGSGREPSEHHFRKTRPDDFIEELKHIEAMLHEERPQESPISLERGLETMLVIAAAHLSEQEKRCVVIDYSAGYSREALKLL
ncbi:MAG: Gfo/Idh/MocA family oxidoreductase [Haliea sp.]